MFWNLVMPLVLLCVHVTHVLLITKNTQEIKAENITPPAPIGGVLIKVR